MAKIIEKDFLAGALLSEIVRQHPDVTLSSAFVDAVLMATDDICRLYNLESESVLNSAVKKIV